MCKRNQVLLALACVCGALVWGCESSDPEGSGAAGAAGSAGASATSCEADKGITALDTASCTAAATDYQPRDSASANDSWPACVSDNNQYVPFSTSISSVARIAAFETIAQLLGFGKEYLPTAQNFIDARVAYTQSEGLESRVSRREDEHYPAASKACRDMTAEELQANPDRCVGPAKIAPIINQAFEAGSQGKDEVVAKARLEAALLWFLYESVYKEAVTCASTAADCDSSYAYYTGGQDRSGGLGLARYIKPRSPQAHDRIWDGLLAVRCWRDLDHPTEAAKDKAMQAQALAQMDKALLRGMALIVRQRLEQKSCTEAWQSVRILGPVLLREAKLRDATQAALLEAELSKTDAAAVDTAKAQQALDSLFACP